MIVAVVALVLAAAPTHQQASPTLQQGFQRESALLSGEQAALVRERERLATENGVRIAALRKDVAALEARVVVEAAATEALRVALEQTSGAAAASREAVDVEASHAVVNAAFHALGLPPPAWQGPASLETLLPGALDAIERKATPQRFASGFFDSEGVYVDGFIVVVGDLAWAASATAAGALLPAEPGASRALAPDEGSAVKDAARALVDGHAPALVPVLLSAPEAEATSTTTLRLQRVGAGAAAAALALGCALVALVFGAWRSRSATRAVDVVAVRAAALLRERESAAVLALLRTVPGPSGRFLRAIAGVAERGSNVDDEVAALVVEAFAVVDRRVAVGRAAVAIAAAVVVAVAAAAWGEAFDALTLRAAERPLETASILDAIAVGFAPLQLAAIAAVPAALLLVASSFFAARLKERLEVVALRLVDAAAGR